MTQLIEAQQENRRKMKEEKQRLDELNKKPEEKMAVIETTFSGYHDALEQDIKKLAPLKVLDRDTVNVLWDSLGDIREYFTLVSLAMNSYNQWKYKKKISDLESSIQELAKKIPRKKFKFRRVQAKKEIDGESIKLAELKQIQEKQQHDAIIDTLKGITDRSNEFIFIPETELDNIGNYKLINLENCRVVMQGTVNLLFIRNVKNCQIWTCPVSNSIMIHEAVNSHLRIIGHQIRMHDCYDTRFDVYTTSKLIIEDCSRLVFAEWLKNKSFVPDKEYGDTKYPNFEAHFRTSNLWVLENLWREV